MIGTEVFELNMPDGRVNALGQFLISDDGRVLHAKLFFHGKYIIAIRAKLLAAVGGSSLFAFLFKGRGESLGLFSCAFLRPCRRDVEGRRPRLELFAIRAAPAVNTDGVGDQLAGLIAALLDVSHYVHPPF